MPRGSSPKRERQYEHIKQSGEQRGMSEGRAKEMASRTVNNERARSGESKTASRSSTQGKSASQRGVEGPSTMTKQQVKNALGH
ncbi:plasmid stabilization protein [Streptomyces goshikiensis]|uniref:plasmid stabilization protein n=1 Tax=Streptomyces goshikiensis TaxID=1942 RepID=UPI0036C413FA